MQHGGGRRRLGAGGPCGPLLSAEANEPRSVARIDMPPLATRIGVELFYSAVSRNATGTAIAPLANQGHSHTNGNSFLIFP